MKQAPQPLLSMEDYLEGELASDLRHQYVAGNACAMVRVRRRGNRVHREFIDGEIALT